MKLYAPDYYCAFSCLADRCRHSCCVGWEIDVDDATMEKYDTLTHPYGENIRKSIEDGHFRLDKRERCPHLDGRGLCRIICELGDAVEIVQLLPYHKLGTVKWERLQRNHPILEAEPPKDELVQARKEQLEAMGLKVMIH